MQTKLKELRARKLKEFKELKEKLQSLDIEIDSKEVLNKIASQLVEQLLAQDVGRPESELSEPLAKAALIYVERELYSPEVVEEASHLISTSLPEELRRTAELLDLPSLALVASFIDGSASTSLSVKKVKKIEGEVEYFLEAVSETFGDQPVQAKTLFTFIFGNQQLPPKASKMFDEFAKKQRSAPAPDPDKMSEEEIKDLLLSVAEKLGELYFLLDFPSKRKVSKSVLRAASRTTRNKWNTIFSVMGDVVEEALAKANEVRKAHKQEQYKQTSLSTETEPQPEVNQEEPFSETHTEQQVEEASEESQEESPVDMVFLNGEIVVSADEIEGVAEYHDISEELARYMVAILIAGLKSYSPSSGMIGEIYAPKKLVRRNVDTYGLKNKKLFDKAYHKLLQLGYILEKKGGDNKTSALNPKYGTVNGEDDPLKDVVKRALDFKNSQHNSN